MCSILQSCDQMFDVNCSPRSEMIVPGTPKRVIQEKTKARAHASADVSERGIASIHLDVRSMIVKMWLQPLMYCKGPNRSLWKWANPPLMDGNGLLQQAGVVVDLAPLAVQAWFCPASDVVGEAAPDKPRRNKAPRGQPPSRVGNAVQMQKKSFRNFAGTMGKKTPMET